MDADTKAFMERAGKILEAGSKLKTALKKRGLTQGKAKCPFCADGYLVGRMHGRKQHLHMACTHCDARMME
jgi:predicted SprT family Zn-dependent metalloprotease